MSGIRKVKLSDACDINMGQSPESSTYNQEGKGIPFFQGKADFGVLHPLIKYYCSEPKKIAQADDILISVRAPIGALNIAVESCCIGRGLSALRAKNNSTSRYLYYALQSLYWELNARGTGSTFKAINKQDLEEILIPLPKVAEQQKIAATLDAVSEVLRLRKAQLAELDNLVKSQFVGMFFQHPNYNIWPIKRLDEISTTRLGKMLDGKRQTGKSSYPYLANFNVQWFSFNLSRLNQMDFDYNDQKEFSLELGDLLICEGGEVGRTAIWHDECSPCFYQKALHRVRCNHDFCLPEYIAWAMFFKASRGEFHSISSSATIAHLPGVKLKSIIFTVPPITIQAQFATFVLKVDQQKHSIQQSLDETQHLFDSLMVEYFED